MWAHVGSCWSQHAPDGSAESSQCALDDPCAQARQGHTQRAHFRTGVCDSLPFDAVCRIVGAAHFRLPFGLWFARDPHIWMPRYAHVSAHPVVQRASAVDAILAVAIALKWRGASAHSPLERTISTGSLTMGMVWTQVSVAMGSACAVEYVMSLRAVLTAYW